MCNVELEECYNKTSESASWGEIGNLSWTNKILRCYDWLNAISVLRCHDWLMPTKYVDPSTIN